VLSRRRTAVRRYLGCHAGTAHVVTSASPSVSIGARGLDRPARSPHDPSQLTSTSSRINRVSNSTESGLSPNHVLLRAGAGYSAALGGESVETGLVGGGHSLLRTAIRGRTSLLPGKDAGKTGFLAMAERQSNLKSPRCTHLFERFPCSIEQGKIFAEQGKMLAKLTI